MKKGIFLGGLAGLALIISSCSGEKGWGVKGSLDSVSDGDKVAIEGYNNGAWYVVDSIEIGRDGAFSYRASQSAAYPDVMRLNGAGLAAPIYFPVSGDEVVTVADGKISGTAMAAQMTRVDSIVNSATLRLGPAATSDPALRRELGDLTTKDTTSVIAYYILNKSINGRPIFDPNEPMGNRIYGAVAQNFAMYNPLDPRGVAVRNSYVEGRKAMKKGETVTHTIEVPASGLIEIERYDNRGELHSLRKLSEEGKVVVLSFTMYQSDFSPAYTVILNDLYEKYRDKGLEIYQLAFDENPVDWKESARNLPWITVYNSPTDGIGVLSMYNVGVLPTTYVIDRQGEIRARVEDPTILEEEVKKYL